MAPCGRGAGAEGVRWRQWRHSPQGRGAQSTPRISLVGLKLHVTAGQLVLVMVCVGGLYPGWCVAGWVPGGYTGWVLPSSQIPVSGVHWYCQGPPTAVVGVSASTGHSRVPAGPFRTPGSSHSTCLKTPPQGLYGEIQAQIS